MDVNEKFYALFIIVNAGHTDFVTDLLREHGSFGATIINARGEGIKREVFMGITLDTEKEIILSVVKTETARSFMTAVKTNSEWKNRLHGICFAMPVEAVTGLGTTIIPPVGVK